MNERRKGFKNNPPVPHPVKALHNYVLVVYMARYTGMVYRLKIITVYCTVMILRRTITITSSSRLGDGPIFLYCLMTTYRMSLMSADPSRWTVAFTLENYELHQDFKNQ